MTTKSSEVSSNAQQHGTENDWRTDIADGSAGPIILPPSEEEHQVVTAPIPGSDSLVVLVNDDILQMVEQNCDLMKHTLIRDARDAKVNVTALVDNEMREVPLITYKATPTYFQFDYRNHDAPLTESMQGLLRKIEATLENADLEPFGRNRGVETIKRNIENLREGDRYRIRKRSRSKSGLIERKKKDKVNVNRYTLLKLLKERHCIYTTGTHERLGQLDQIVLGRSLFGPESDVKITSREVEQVLNELWFQGVSSRFRGLQRTHFALLRRKEAKNRTADKIMDIIRAANVDVSNRNTKKEVFKKIKAALRDSSNMTEEVRAILEAAKKMNVGIVRGKLRSAASSNNEANTDELSDGESEDDSDGEESEGDSDNEVMRSK